MFRRNRKRDALASLDEDIRQHIEEETQENIARGMPPDQARSAAMRRFGNVALAKEDTRAVWKALWLEQLSQDLRYAARTLRKSPSFAAVAIVTIALGIGATTTVFSVVNAVLVRSLPYSNADRIVRIVQDRPAGNPRRLDTISSGDVYQLRQQATGFSDVEAFESIEQNLLEENQSISLRGARVSTGMFHLLGHEAALGRTFNDLSAFNDVILSDSTWRTYFGASEAVLESTINFNGRGYTVLGVMGPDFAFPDYETEFWIPLEVSPFSIDVGEGGRVGVGGTAQVQAIALLDEGISLPTARAEAGVLFAALRETEDQARMGVGARLIPVKVEGATVELIDLKEQVVAPVRRALLVFAGAVGLVLLIACTNIATLLLARTAGRKAEMAIRGALGAARSRLIRQVLTESSLLAVFGGVLGTLIALGGVQAVRTIGLGHVPRIEEVRIDLSVLAFVLAVSVVAGILFGLVPALRLPRSHIEAIHKGHAAASSGSDLLGRNRPLSVLGSAEIALALVLLTGAGLLINSFLKVSHFDWGYDPANVLTFETSRGFFHTGSFYEDVLSRIEGLPGVRSASVANSVPVLAAESFFVGPNPPIEVREAGIRIVSRDYLQTIGAKIVEGRSFEEGDGPGQPAVAVVNQAFARELTDPDALGQRVGFFGKRLEIVGITGDMRYAGLDSEPEPELYLNFLQAPELLPPRPPPPPPPPGVVETILPITAVAHANFFATRFVIRTVGDPLDMVRDIRNIISDADPEMRVTDIATIERGLEQYYASPRFYAVLMASFSAIALVIATVGVYGVMFYSISRRTRELGIRMAFGATRGDVMRLVLRQGLTLISFGVAAGLIGALALTRFMESLLFGLTPTDFVTFAVAAALLIFAAGLAIYIPAQRTTKVDPTIAVRYE